MKVSLYRILTAFATANVTLSQSPAVINNSNQ